MRSDGVGSRAYNQEKILETPLGQKGGFIKGGSIKAGGPDPGAVRAAALGL